MLQFIGYSIGFFIASLAVMGILFWESWFVSMIWPWFIEHPTPDIPVIAGILGMTLIFRTKIIKKRAKEEQVESFVYQMITPPFIMGTCYLIKTWFM